MENYLFRLHPCRSFRHRHFLVDSLVPKSFYFPFSIVDGRLRTMLTPTKIWLFCGKNVDILWEMETWSQKWIFSQEKWIFQVFSR